MATLDIDVIERGNNQFRYAELCNATVNPPDIIMTPLGCVTSDGQGRDPEFDDVMQEADFAINCGILPQLISAGSSGSYFVRNRNSVRTTLLRVFEIITFQCLKYRNTFCFVGFEV